MVNWGQVSGHVLNIIGVVDVYGSCREACWIEYWIMDIFWQGTHTYMVYNFIDLEVLCVFLLCINQKFIIILKTLILNLFYSCCRTIA